MTGNPLATTIVAILEEARTSERTAIAAHLSTMLLPAWATNIMARGQVTLSPDGHQMAELFNVAGWDVEAAEVRAKREERLLLKLGAKATDLKTVFSLAPPARALQDRFLWFALGIGPDAFISHADPRRCATFIKPNRNSGAYWLAACRPLAGSDMVSADGDTEALAMDRLTEMARAFCVEELLEEITEELERR
jgi:hypothetical protein